MTETVNKELHTAIAAAMGDIKRLEKESRNAHANYDYAGIDAFMDLCRPICAAHGLHIQPNCVDYELIPQANKMWAKYVFEFVVAHSSGQQTAPQKSVVFLMVTGAQTSGSAQSYALKQFLRGLLLISTGDNDDADAFDNTEIVVADTQQTKQAQQSTAHEQDDVWQNWYETQLRSVRSMNKPAAQAWANEQENNLKTLEQHYPGLFRSLNEAWENVMESM